MTPSRIIFNAALTSGFQTSKSILIAGELVVLDFRITIAGRTPVSVQWYPEYSSDNPYDTNSEWFREVAEEDVGNGDVRMPYTIRRFSTQGIDTALAPGTYRFTVQLKRAHQFCRIQIAGAGATAVVASVFDDVPTPASS